MEIVNKRHHHVAMANRRCNNCGSDLRLDLKSETISYTTVTERRLHYPDLMSCHNETRTFTDRVGTVQCPVCRRQVEVARETLKMV